MAEWHTYNPQSNLNVAPPPNGAPEGHSADRVNDIAREMMGVIARMGADIIKGTLTTSGTNTLTLQTTGTLTSYFEGLFIRAKAGGTNTGAVTLNIGGMGAEAVVLQNGSALEGGEIKSGHTFDYLYRSNQFVLLNPGGGVLDADRIAKHLTRAEYEALSTYEEIFYVLTTGLAPAPSGFRLLAEVVFVGTGTGMTRTISTQTNVSSVGDQGVGHYRLNFTNDLPNTNVHILIGIQEEDESRGVTYSAITTSSIDVHINDETNMGADSDRVSVIVLGKG